MVIKDGTFENRIDMLAPDEYSTTLNTNYESNYARIDQLDTYGLEYVLERIDKQGGLMYEITETATNLGVEVWEA